MRGSYDPIIFKTERANKKKGGIMPTRIDTIVKLILEEAKERTGFKDYCGKIYDVKLDVDLRIGMVVKSILDEEREKAKKEGGA